MYNYGTSNTDWNAAVSSIIGAWACIAIFAIAMIALLIVVYWKILQKAGYNGAWSLLVLVPGIGWMASLGILLFLAFGDWPVLRARTTVPPPPVRYPTAPPPAGPGYGAPGYAPPPPPMAQAPTPPPASAPPTAPMGSSAPMVAPMPMPPATPEEPPAVMGEPMSTEQPSTEPPAIDEPTPPSEPSA